MNKYNNIQTFDQLIEVEHGEIGSDSRNKYEESSQMFIISEMLKDGEKRLKSRNKSLQKGLAQKKAIYPN
ncbi:hypothetical protein [Pedobacter aquatilis]|uniref:hypothetical protein n=1 Tax=Pedobacter aquatilis TaxID=351343 RepID=UPI0029307A98|nr:hypothetical protein [Pedobacter aquatilis]